MKASLILRVPPSIADDIVNVSLFIVATCPLPSNVIVESPLTSEKDKQVYPNNLNFSNSSKSTIPGFGLILISVFDGETSCKKSLSS